MVTHRLAVLWRGKLSQMEPLWFAIPSNGQRGWHSL